MKSWSAYYEGTDADIGKFVGELCVHRKMIQEISACRPQTALEIGCGTSRFSIFLSHLGVKVTAADSDPGVLAQARSLRAALNGKVDYLQADAFSLPFADSTFDVCFHQGLMEHFSDEQIHTMLAEQLRVAGRVVFSVPNNRYPSREFGNERLLSSRQWERILARFNVVASFNYHRQRPRGFIGSLCPLRRIMYLAAIQR